MIRENYEGEGADLANETSKPAGDEEIATETTKNPAQEDFQGEDFFVIPGGIVCLNAADIAWVQELEKTEGELIGEIKRSGGTDNLAEWDATVLPVGTKIYKHKEHFDILVATNENGKTLYMKMIEG